MSDPDMEKARKIAHGYFCGHCSDPTEQQSNGHSLICNTLTAAIATAIKAEREACAAFIETHTTDYCRADKVVPLSSSSVSNTALAAAIRARGG